MSRLRGFDGLRAIAALSIVVLHVTSSTGASVHGSFARYFARFDAGVAIFFVISGFLLYRSFVAAHLDPQRTVDVPRFYRRRAVRIYPAYWIALTAVIFVFRDGHIHGVGDYLAHYSLMQIYTPRLLSGITPAWTLAVEVSFYLLLPAYTWLLGRATRGRTAATAVWVELAGAAIVFAGSLAGRAILGAADGTDTYKLKWLPFMADWFALGLALAILKVAYDTGCASRAGRWLVDAADRAPVALVIVSVAAFVLVAHIGLPTNFRAGSVAQDVTRQFLYGVFAVALVAIAALRVAHRDPIRAALDARVLVLLGIISYGIFLWHDAFVVQFEQWHFATHVTRFTTLALLVAVLACTLVVATASWIWVERPLLTTSERKAREEAR